MSSAKKRLELCGEILSLIERKRAESGNETLGAEIERAVLDTQFREIEREILVNPGPIKPWLIRMRRGEA